MLIFFLIFIKILFRRLLNYRDLSRFCPTISGRVFHLAFIFLLLLCSPQVGAQTRMVVYDGITGVYNISMRDDTVVINTVLKKSAADRAGIRMRDQLLSVNGVPVSGRGMTSREVNSLLTGKQGEQMDLVIRRGGREELFEFTLIRDPYLSQITTYDYRYLIDSLNRWSLQDVLSGRLDSLFVDPLEAKITVASVEKESRADSAGIRTGDRLISLADEMDKDFYFHISHPVVRTVTTDSVTEVLREDSLLRIHLSSSPERDLAGITSRFEQDMSSKSIWLKIHTRNRITQNRNYVLNFPELEGGDSLIFYHMNPGGDIIRKKAGVHLPVSERDFVYKNWRAVSLLLMQEREQEFYVRLHSSEGLGPPLMELIAQETINIHDRLERMLLFGFFGMMLIIAIFYILFYLAFQGRQYLFFSLYILSFAIFLFISQGYLAEYQWNPGGFLSEFMVSYEPFLISLVSIFFLLFGIAYLDLKRKFVWWYRSILIVIGLIMIRMILVMVDSFVGIEMGEEMGDLVLIAWALAVGVFPMFIMVVPSIIRIRDGFMPAWFFLVANVVLVPLAYISIMAAPFSLTVLTLYESDLMRILHVSGIFLAAILQILIFSIGLTRKLRHDEIERKEAREKIIEQLRENEKLKDKVNRELEQKVQERTREIIEQKEEIESQRDEIEAQRDLVLSQKLKITDSIAYAQRIQNAVLPQRESIHSLVNDYFVLYKPRDIVSGDFYWIKEVKSKLVAVVADSTGHGVPGAFMSMLGITLLNELMAKSEMDRPGETLEQLRAKVKEMLYQHGDPREQKDGMDMAIAVIDRQKGRLVFAGANMRLFLVGSKRTGSDNELRPLLSSKEGGFDLFEFRGNRQPIGIHWEERKFTSHRIPIQEGDRIYMFSDGYVDQYGGEERKKFKLVQFKQLLLSMQGKPMDEQQRQLEEVFETWRGREEQIDDVCVVGLKV